MIQIINQSTSAEGHMDEKGNIFIRDVEKGHDSTRHLLKKVTNSLGESHGLFFLAHNKNHPFAVWFMSPDGNTYSGDYHSDLIEALACLQKRGK